eukprot:1658261-Amphidinium_carterae.1
MNSSEYNRQLRGKYVEDANVNVDLDRKCNTEVPQKNNDTTGVLEALRLNSFPHLKAPIKKDVVHNQAT